MPSRAGGSTRQKNKGTGMYLSQGEAQDNGPPLPRTPYRSHTAAKPTEPIKPDKAPEKARSSPEPRRRLPAGDELALVWRWQRRKDYRARDALVRAFQPAIESMARKYSGRGLEIEDRVSLGTIGFLTALDRFDIQRRLRLWTYARQWVRAEITAEMAKCQSLVWQPRQRKQTDINGQAGWLWHNGWSGPHDESLNAPVTMADGDAGERIELLTDVDEEHGDQTQNESLREAVTDALSVLSERERIVFSARWLSDDPPQLWKIAAEIGVSAERIRQIEVKAFAKIEARANELRQEREGRRNPRFPRGITLAEFADRKCRSALSRSWVKHPRFRDRRGGVAP